MIKRIIESTGLNLKYKAINQNRVFSFDVMEHILIDDENNEYLLGIAFKNEDKTELNNAYNRLMEESPSPTVLCFELESLLILFCPILLIRQKKIELGKNKNVYPTFSYVENKNDDGVDFSLNKFELIYPSNTNYLIAISHNGVVKNIPLTITGKKAKVGTWNSYICRTHFLLMIEFIFKSFPSVETIDYDNVLFDPLVSKTRWRHNDFYLPLPSSSEELKSKISAKSRHNIKREKRIIEETFGNLRLEDVNVADGFPPELISSFYLNKTFTHQVTQQDYDITKRNITNAYVLKTGENDIRGIALSCEQGDVVFIENHTFDSSLKQYSFGQVLYDMYLEELIKKGKKGLSLAGGDLSYKKRYGSICFISYSGSIKRKNLILIKRLKKTNWQLSDLITRLLFIFNKR